MMDSYDSQSITLQVLNRNQKISVDTNKTILDNLLLHNISSEISADQVFAGVVNSD